MAYVVRTVVFSVFGVRWSSESCGFSSVSINVREIRRLGFELSSRVVPTGVRADDFPLETQLAWHVPITLRFSGFARRAGTESGRSRSIKGSSNDFTMLQECTVRVAHASRLVGALNPCRGQYDQAKAHTVEGMCVSRLAGRHWILSNGAVAEAVNSQNCSEDDTVGVASGNLGRRCG